MRYLIALLLIAPAFAQEAGGASAAASQTQATPAAQPADAAPAGDAAFTGSIDFGYRWRTPVIGSAATYQSIVNLRQGPRLFGADFTIRDPKKRLFDRLTARGYNWGDPYNTAHVDATKSRWYDFRFDYSNVLYYNALPSFANPAAPGGFNEQAYDTHNRNTTAAIDLLPNRRIVPYFVFNRNTRSGTGITSVADQNADVFSEPTSFLNLMNDYRGGLRFEFGKYHATLEEGGSTFQDNESIFNQTANQGAFTNLYLGQQLALNSVLEAYGIRAHSVYSKGLFTASPFRWVNLYGQFLFSEPKTDVSYQQAAAGSFVIPSSLFFYTGQLGNISGAANKPHISGSAGFEIRPLRRVRILESWSTDRFHDSAYATVASIFMTPPTQTATNSLLNSLESVNYNRTETNIFFDPISKVTLRGGYRYEWGDATLPASLLNTVATLDSGKLSRQVAIAGINVRPFGRLTLNGTYEGSSTSRAYFQTSLYNYSRTHAQARYQLSSSLAAQVGFNDMQNHNPVLGMQYQFESRDNSAALTWAPKEGKRFSILGEYDRQTINSSVNYLNLPFLTQATSIYNLAAQMATGAVDVALPKIGRAAGKLSVGGSLAVTNGTRTSRYYQPFGRLTVPFGKHIAWNSEWQWYGFNEQLFMFEAFHTHLLQTGLRLTR